MTPKSKRKIVSTQSAEYQIYERVCNESLSIRFFFSNKIFLWHCFDFRFGSRSNWRVQISKRIEFKEHTIPSFDHLKLIIFRFIHQFDISKVGWKKNGINLRTFIAAIALALSAKERNVCRHHRHIDYSIINIQSY